GARLFSRFEQGDNSVTRRFGGTGLGLAIAQRLALMMHGRIDCEAAVGRGAVFIFQAPVEHASVADHVPEPEPVEDPMADREPISVLLAEDNLVNQKVVQAILSEFVDLTIVPDGQMAVEAAAQRKFDIVLMDTHMPVMDGLTAIRQIRALE